MHFTPPPPIDKKTAENIDSSKLDPNSPKVQKYKEKYQLREKQAAQKMAQKVADEKRKKRSDFLLELIKAIIISSATLIIEHSPEIIRFIGNLLSSSPQ